MKKGSFKFLFLVIFVITAFSFSTSSIAAEQDSGYKDGQIISTSDSLDPSYLSWRSEQDAGYKDGQILSVSDSLDSTYLSSLAGQDSEYKEGQILSGSSSKDNSSHSIAPSGFFDYKDKTITVFYANFSSVPQTYYYTEYTNGYWYKGNLDLTSVVRASNGWTATFSGVISARID